MIYRLWRIVVGFETADVFAYALACVGRGRDSSAALRMTVWKDLNGRASNARPYEGCVPWLSGAVREFSTIPQSALLTAPFTQGRLCEVGFETADVFAYALACVGRGRDSSATLRMTGWGEWFDLAVRWRGLREGKFIPL